MKEATDLHQFNHIAMVQLLQDGDLSVHPLQRLFHSHSTAQSPRCKLTSPPRMNPVEDRHHSFRNHLVTGVRRLLTRHLSNLLLQLVLVELDAVL
uniref:Uncharacterized protein n=1 Tax=Nothobranchius furzeri TaxID=105023 RepID=A0A8C6KD75_NOTFU